MKTTFEREISKEVDLSNTDQFPILAIHYGTIGLLCIDEVGSPWFIPLEEKTCFSAASGTYYHYRGKVTIESES